MHLSERARRQAFLPGPVALLSTFGKGREELHNNYLYAKKALCCRVSNVSAFLWDWVGWQEWRWLMGSYSSRTLERTLGAGWKLQLLLLQLQWKRRKQEGILRREMPIGVIPAASAFLLQGFLGLSVSLPTPLPTPEFWSAAVHSPFRAHVTDPLRGCQLPIVLGASPAFLLLMRGNARGLAPTSSEMLDLLVSSSPGSSRDTRRISVDPSASHTKDTCWMQ